MKAFIKEKRKIMKSNEIKSEVVNKSEKKMIRVVIAKPFEPPIVEVIEKSLDSYYKIIGCNYIDMVDLDKGIDIIVDDEGLLKDFIPNMAHPYDSKSTLVGTCIFAARDDEGATVSLNDKQIDIALSKIEELRGKMICNLAESLLDDFSDIEDVYILEVKKDNNLILH